MAIITDIPSDSGDSEIITLFPGDTRDSLLIGLLSDWLPARPRVLAVGPCRVYGQFVTSTAQVSSAIAASCQDCGGGAVRRAWTMKAKTCATAV